MPPIVEVTSPDLVYVRSHGRSRETWEQAGVTVQERTKYLYNQGELKEWAPRFIITGANRHGHDVFRWNVV